MKRAPDGAPRESAILGEIRKALGSETDLVLWRNNCGGMQDATGRLVRYGLCEGSADLVGILTMRVMFLGRPMALGRFFALEVKRPHGSTAPRRKEMQRLFAELVRRMGGFCARAESVTEARAALERAREGHGE
jgi:hypothetical protein